ncbi:MAG: PAS domain S-box protein [Candidatus Desantisbacteria bacterium]
MEKAKGYCRDDGDMAHLYASLEMAKKLLEKEGGNERIVIPAIILHDTGWHIFSRGEEQRVRKPVLSLEDMELKHKHEIEGSNIARKILQELALPEGEIDQIAEIILWHDTRKKPISKEDSLVKDADKLSRYTPECFSLFPAKIGRSEKGFFQFLSENIEGWFWTDTAKFLAREHLLIKRIGQPEAELSKKLYEILIRLEQEVDRTLQETLEKIAINSVREKVLDVQQMIKIYLVPHKTINLSELQADEDFIKIATQKVGKGSFIGIIDRQTGQIIFHPDKRLINQDRDLLKKMYRPPEFLHGFWEWHDRAIKGEEFYSFYQGMNIKGEIIDKFAYVLPLDINGLRWAIIVATDYDEFFKPVDILSQDVISSLRSVSLQIGGLSNLFEEEKERLDVTLRSIGDGVIVADTKGLVVLLNKVAEELTGWKEKDALTRHTGDVFYIVNEQTRQRCEDPVEKVISSGGIVGLANNTVLIGKDGQERIIADSGAPVYDKNGNMLGVVLVFRDITERKRMEERLRDMERLEVLTQISAEAAHEVRNPLQVISSGLYLLKETLASNDKAQRTISQMDDAVLRATGFINDLLERGSKRLKEV